MDGTNEQYLKILKEEFNTVVAENATKPYMMEPERGTFVFSRADKLAGFAEQNGMKMRGHCLVWHKQIPKWMNNDQLSQEELLSVLKEYITTVVGHLKGKVYAWDVVNEAIDENEPDHYRKSVWMKVIGPGYIDSAFVWAHQADPDALLFYNDYGAEAMNAKSDAVYELVKGMKDRGIPIDGVGLQCHFQVGKIDFDGLKKNMQRLEDLGLQTQITELDISIDTGKENAQTLKQQADAYGKLARIWLEDQNCTAFMIWGLSDQYSWIPSFSNNKRGTPLLWDENFNKKPAYYQVLNQLKEASVN
jgi:endo-1,4-beta-xylanase